MQQWAQADPRVTPEKDANWLQADCLEDKDKP